MIPPINGQQVSYHFFSMKNGVEVQWRESEHGCLYHATYDGVLPLCGVKATLTQPTRPWGLCVGPYDPSDDMMTCLRCAGMVRRVKNSPP